MESRPLTLKEAEQLHREEVKGTKFFLWVITAVMIAGGLFLLMFFTNLFSESNEIETVLDVLLFGLCLFAEYKLLKMRKESQAYLKEILENREKLVAQYEVFEAYIVSKEFVEKTIRREADSYYSLSLKQDLLGEKVIKIQCSTAFADKLRTGDLVKVRKPVDSNSEEDMVLISS